MKNMIKFILPVVIFTPSLFAQTHTVNIDGYVNYCQKDTTIYKKQNNDWVETITLLPYSGLYYLDGKFVSYGMCDVVSCHKLDKPYIINLIEYQITGQEPPPANSGARGNANVYKSVPLTGEIKIVVDYYSDEQCQIKQSYTEIINHSVKAND